MNLQEFRKNQGVSQQWLAEKMGLTQLTISRYERGETTPQESFWYQLAYIFRFTPKELSEKIEKFNLD